MFNPSWQIADIISNLDKLKDAYSGVISSFSYFRKKDLLIFKRQIKTEVYSLPIEEYQRNFVWRFFNDEEELETTLRILGVSKTEIDNFLN